MKTKEKLKLNWKQVEWRDGTKPPIWFVENHINEDNKPLIRIERLIMEKNKPYLIEWMGYHRMIVESISYDDNSIMKSAENDLKKIIKHLYSKLELDKIEEIKDEHWICNECNFKNFTMSVPEQEIELELHNCINCGGFEFHKG